MVMPFFLGALHCLEADHAIAVAVVTANDSTRKKVIYQGMAWGIGHSLSVLVIGLIYILLRVFVLQEVAMSLEVPVGFMLIVAGFLKLLRSNDPKISGKKTTLGVGLIHGLAGSSGLVLAQTFVEQSVYNQVSYLLLFSSGTILGMGLLNVVFSYVGAVLSRVRFISYLIPIISICYGVLFVCQNL